MGQKKKKKQRWRDRKKHREQPTYTDRLKAEWIDRYPVLIFVLGFAGLLGLFYGISMTSLFRDSFQPGVTDLNALVASVILNTLGQDTSFVGSTIHSTGFTVNVKFGCDAIEPAALYIAALLAFPAPYLKKIPCLIAGTCLLLTVNLVRIISLFLTGIYFPDAFEVMHGEIWQVLFILLAIVSWSYSIHWATRKQ